MVALIFFLLNVGASFFKPKSWLEAENAALRQQLIVLQRQVRGRVQFTNSDRLFFIQLYRWFPSVVCTENLVRFDLMTESLNVGRDGRADILPLERGRVVLQAQELA